MGRTTFDNIADNAGTAHRTLVFIVASIIAVVVMIALSRTEEESIIVALRSADIVDDRAARRILHRLAIQGTLNEKLVLRIGHLLENDDPAVRSAASKALATIGEQAKPLLPQLLRQLDSTDPAVREQVVAALASIGGAEAKFAVPRLLTMLRDAEGDTWSYSLRLQLIDTLGVLGGQDREVATALMDCARRGTVRSRRHAIRALGSLEDEAGLVVDFLLDIVKEDALCRSALFALGWIGRRDERVIDTLGLVLAEDDWRKRHEAVLALKRLGVTSAELVDRLRNGSRTAPPAVRGKFRVALQRVAERELKLD